MPFFAVKNLTEVNTEPCNPWEFKITETIPEDVRTKKSERQKWYQTPAVRHCFYTALEGANKVMRVSKENPIAYIHGFVADYDIQITEEAIDKAVYRMKIKPSKVEGSIGGNWRLVWTFERPLATGGNEFAVFILRRAIKWLSLGILPDLDEPAFTGSSRLFCCGDTWKDTGHPPISQELLAKFFFDCGNAYKFKSPDEVVVDLETVEAALKARYDGFDWPDEFVLESQGPTFWVAGSTSPKSAIVKSEGMYTFSAHAEKPFYSWGDLLGKEFIEQHASSLVAKATTDLWYDGRKYHRRAVEGDSYVSMDPREASIHLRVDCGISDKKTKGGMPLFDKVIAHIHMHNRIEGAAPFCPRPFGIFVYNHQRFLNTYNCKPIQPTTRVEIWGPDGNFPWLSRHLETLFIESDQLVYFICWLQHFYKSLLAQYPTPGQCVLMVGKSGVGKTFTSREIIGHMAGGFADASKMIVGGSQFNSSLITKPVLSLDDDSISVDSARSGATSNLKKWVANQDFMFSKKYENDVPVEWGGRVVGSANTDADSTQIIGTLEEGLRDKILLLRCREKEDRQGFKFSSDRAENIRRRDAEIASFAKWVLDYQIPDHVVRHDRFGIVAKHDAELFGNARQSSPATAFREQLISVMTEHFTNNPGLVAWEGRLLEIQQLIRNSTVATSLDIKFTSEQLNKKLTQLHHDQSVSCSFKLEGSANQQTRIWSFPRSSFV